MAKFGKLRFQNLVPIFTQKCTLDCGHCMGGKGCNIDMSDAVIDAILDQTYHIEYLGLSGGEITIKSAIKQVEKFLAGIKERHILVNELEATINATIYSEDLLRLLCDMNDYIKKTSKTHNEINCSLYISIDEFHNYSIDNKNLRAEFTKNLNKYCKSIFYNGERIITGKVIREGNAENLPKEETVPLKPIYKYFNEEESKIGELVCINATGTITEPNASYKHMEELYNYGNVLNDSISEAYVKTCNGLYIPKR
jgi:hypothetical protein